MGEKWTASLTSNSPKPPWTVSAATRSPTRKPVTPAPTASTTPATWYPGTNGIFGAKLSRAGLLNGNVDELEDVEHLRASFAGQHHGAAGAGDWVGEAMGDCF